MNSDGRNLFSNEKLKRLSDIAREDTISLRNDRQERSRSSDPTDRTRSQALRKRLIDIKLADTDPNQDLQLNTYHIGKGQSTTDDHQLKQSYDTNQAEIEGL